MSEPPSWREDCAEMERLVAGEDDALDVLMDRHAGRLLAYLKRLLQNDSDAEELAQEAFVRVFERREQFDLKRPFSTWLYAIATNLARDRLRWRSRRPEAPLDGETGDRPEALERNQIPDTNPHPGEELLRAERAEAVRNAVGRLPPELRAPLILSEFEDRSHAEIGEILGCTAKAVEVRVYRARQALRKALARWISDDGTKKG